MSLILTVVRSILVVLTILILFLTLRSRQHFDTYFYTNRHLTVGVSSFNSVLRFAYRDGSVGVGFHSQRGQKEAGTEPAKFSFAIRPGSDLTTYPSLYYLDLGWALICTISTFLTAILCFWRYAKGISSRGWTRASSS